MAKSRVTVKNSFNDVRTRLGAAVSRAVRDATYKTLDEAVDNAPLQDGQLRGSGSAHWNGERIATGADVNEAAKGDWAAVRVQESTPFLGVVHFNAFYAADQHESMEHAHPSGGQAKYLENAVVNQRQAMYQRIAEEMRKEIR
jgi:hypothetical protein